jgi:hypothetical protein
MPETPDAPVGPPPPRRWRFPLSGATESAAGRQMMARAWFTHELVNDEVGHKLLSLWLQPVFALPQAATLVSLLQELAPPGGAVEWTEVLAFGPVGSAARERLGVGQEQSEARRLLWEQVLAALGSVCDVLDTLDNDSPCALAITTSLSMTLESFGIQWRWLGNLLLQLFRGYLRARSLGLRQLPLTYRLIGGPRAPANVELHFATAADETVSEALDRLDREYKRVRMALLAAGPQGRRPGDTSREVLMRSAKVFYLVEVRRCSKRSVAMRVFGSAGRFKDVQDDLERARELLREP